MQLNGECSQLTTFWTPWGRYLHLRMPLGIYPAPECCQSGGLGRNYKLVDDILITGHDANMDEATKDHDANLLKLLQRWRERNLKLNRDKLQLKCSDTPFIGHLLMREGVKPDPSKLEAILKMERPMHWCGSGQVAGNQDSQECTKEIQGSRIRHPPDSPF